VILEMLAAGEIYLWGVRLLAPHLTAENHREVLRWARGKKSKLAVQEIVARIAPQPDVPTTIWKIPALISAPNPAPEAGVSLSGLAQVADEAPVPSNGAPPPAGVNAGTAARSGGSPRSITST
jgi:hypothetical protein